MEETGGYEPFYAVCRAVENEFASEWQQTDEQSKMRKLEREKKAMMGYAPERRYFTERIRDILMERGITDVEAPPWYENLPDGIFHEVYGLAGLAPWVYDQTEAYRNSASAKLIGDRLYCLIDGHAVLQPQRIGADRREQLKRTLLMAAPRERLEQGFHEVYLHNGIRITIYGGDRTKKGQDVMVFRKYVLQDLSLEALAALGTIPPEAVPLFRDMVAVGPNVLIAGPVRSGKTTFLQVWQRQEDPALEGLAIATDPETPWHTMMPDAPIMQLVADGEALRSMTKSLVRGDNDYVLLEEMRDADAYHLALEITATGTYRTKATIHVGSSVEIPYKMATAVREQYGGDLMSLIAQVFSQFHLVFLLGQEPENRARKRLLALDAFHYDAAMDRVSIHPLCRYEAEEQRWRWRADTQALSALPLEKERGEWKDMMERLQGLAERNPLKGHPVIYPRYYRPDYPPGFGPESGASGCEERAGA